MRTCNYLQHTSKYILQGLSKGFQVVSRGLSLVIYDSTICEIVCAFAIIFPSFAEIFCSRLNRRIYTHYTNFFMHYRKQSFKGTQGNFCKSKKCIIFNVNYRPGSKKSKFDMTLIRHSPYIYIAIKNF